MSNTGGGFACLVLAGLMGFSAGNLFADEDHWTGNGNDSLWSNPANWNLGAVPTASDNVWIDLPGDYQVTVDVTNQNFSGIVQNVTLGAASGTQTLTLTNGLSYAGIVTVLTNGVLDVEAGSLTGTNLLVQGTMLWNGGAVASLTAMQYAGHDSILIAGTLQTGGSTNLFSAAHFTNNGTVFWNNSGSFNSEVTSFFQNNASFVLQTNLTISGLLYFNNAGLMAKPDGAGSSAFTIQNNYFQNTGSFLVGTNSILNVGSTANISCNTGTTFSGGGTIRFVNGGLGGIGTITVNDIFELAGGRLVGTNTWTGPGLFNWRSGSLYYFGHTTIAAGFHLNFFSGVILQHTLDNFGTITLNGLLNAGNLLMPSFLNNGGLFIVTNGGGFSGAGAFSNQVSGTFQSVGGNIVMTWPLYNAGRLDLDTGVFSNVWDIANTPSAIERFVLGGYGAGANYTQVAPRSFAYQGTLLVTLTNNFVPENGSSFTLVTNQTQGPLSLPFYVNTGTFASTLLPTLPAGLAWNLIYRTNALKLTVALAPRMISSPVRQANGHFGFTLNGPLGSAYSIESSTNLLDWILLETNSPFDGSVDFNDPTAANFNHRFYRARIIP